MPVMCRAASHEPVWSATEEKAKRNPKQRDKVPQLLAQNGEF